MAWGLIFVLLLQAECRVCFIMQLVKRLCCLLSGDLECGVSFLDLAVYRYDFETQHAFVGDYSGQITLLKLEQNACSVITTLKGHEGKIYIFLMLNKMPAYLSP